MQDTSSIFTKMHKEEGGGGGGVKKFSLHQGHPPLAGVLHISSTEDPGDVSNLIFAPNGSLLTSWPGTVIWA